MDQDLILIGYTEDKPIQLCPKSEFLNILDCGYLTINSISGASCYEVIDGYMQVEYQQVRVEKIIELKVEDSNWRVKSKLEEFPDIKNISMYIIKKVATIQKKVKDGELHRIIKDKVILLKSLDGLTKQVIIKDRLSKTPTYTSSIQLIKARDLSFYDEMESTNPKIEDVSYATRIYTLDLEDIDSDLPVYKESF